MNTATSSADRNKTISENIRKQMARFGTPVSRIALVIGLDRSTVSRKLNNIPGWNWTEDDVTAIAGFFEIDKAELLLTNF